MKIMNTILVIAGEPVQVLDAGKSYNLLFNFTPIINFPIL